MKSITIHKLDASLDRPQRDRQQEVGLNKTVEGLLKESLGFVPDRQVYHREDFSEFMWDLAATGSGRNGLTVTRRIWRV